MNAERTTICNAISGQPFFDKFAADAGCSNSLGSVAVFDCLRNASVTDIRSAINASQGVLDYESAAAPWQPSADGTFLTAAAQRLVLNGSVADVPFVISEHQHCSLVKVSSVLTKGTGDDDDEGTLFSWANSNITWVSRRFRA